MMTLQTITPDSAQWDVFVARQPRAHVLQQSAWGVLKSAYGWGVARVALADETGIRAGAQLLFKRLPLGLGTMAYIGMGPYGDGPSLWPELWAAVDDCARRQGAAFLKWEPGIYRDGEAPPDFAWWGFRESPQTVQPPRTVLIDIGGEEDSILARMNQGTRRKIRQSLKNGVEYQEGTQADVATFTAMMQTTGVRNEFGVHEPAYYEKAYELFVPSGDGALILATHESDPLAGIMVFAKGEMGWYMYGASSNVKRNLMAAYGVQWRAIQWARARGCTAYDMWGVPDEDADTLEAGFQERSDGLWGVYGFKRGWGGEVVRSAGAWDKVYNPLVYNAYKLVLRVRG
ncbi:MAG: peptidoglycan bridge formation glycyltransferase FemA/FemB family protein [Anaerolineaceae bacterium]|nr:peptidoglycan bridge formation glycyltransferase FemA/FemB family protein [Anaerolineaceae bacterium]